MGKNEVFIIVYHFRASVEFTVISMWELFFCFVVQSIYISLSIVMLRKSWVFYVEIVSMALQLIKRKSFWCRSSFQKILDCILWGNIPESWLSRTYIQELCMAVVCHFQNSMDYDWTSMYTGHFNHDLKV